MPGRVPSMHGSWSGAGADYRYVPVDQTTCCSLSLFEDWGGMLFANVCAWFLRLCYGVGGERRCLGTLGAPGGSAHLGSISFANLPLVCVGPELRRRIAGHALRAEFGEGIVFVVLWEFTR